MMGACPGSRYPEYASGFGIGEGVDVLIWYHEIKWLSHKSFSAYSALYEFLLLAHNHNPVPIFYPKGGLCNMQSESPANSRVRKDRL